MLLETLTSYLLPIETELRAVVRCANPCHAGLFDMLSYHMGWADAAGRPAPQQSGKRVRPVLCLLACKACGGDWEQALPAAAAIELLHNFTLIHDDIEDRDETRRGRATVWKLWGEAQAINAGDALFGLSHLALLRLSERGVPSAVILEVMRLFNQAELDLTCGQYLDIGFETQDRVPVADYLTMIDGKTAALAACSCEVGSLIAAAPEAIRKHMRTFGRHLGLAFQMRDDILGIWGNPAVTGKPVGADIARRKKSLPILHGLEQSEALRALLAQETLSAETVRQAMDLLEETRSREYVEQMAQEHHTRALEALREANLKEPAAQELYAMAHVLLTRDR